MTREITVDDIMSTRPCEEWPRERVQALFDAAPKPVTIQALANCAAVSVSDRRRTLIRLLPFGQRSVFAAWCAEAAADAANKADEYAAYKAAGAAYVKYADADFAAYKAAEEAAAYAAKVASIAAYKAAQAAAYAAKAADAAETYAVFDAAEAAADAAKYAGDDRSVTETKQLNKLADLLSKVNP